MLEDDLGSVGEGDTAISGDEGMVLEEYFLAVETTVAAFTVDDLFSRIQHERGLDGLAAIVVNAGGQFVAARAGMGRDGYGEEDDALL